jgi:LysM repeat protein
MRQIKRLFYMVLLNIIISTVTVAIVLQLWEQNHPAISPESTPVIIIVTSTSANNLPISENNFASGTVTPGDTSIPISGTIQASPTFALLTYRIKEGDTLGALAIQFNVSVIDIMAVNNLTDPDSINVGQIIYIPTAPLPTATSTPTPTTIPASSTPRPPATSTPRITLTATPTPIIQEAQAVIDTVIGAGVLENERVRLRRTGDGELSLAGWRLEDGMGNKYIFPQLTLYKDGAINLNTRTGQNTVVDLFWGLTSPIWKSDKTVLLYDSQNVLRSTYTVP